MDAQPVGESGLHTDGTTHADLARALDEIRARGSQETGRRAWEARAERGLSEGCEVLSEG